MLIRFTKMHGLGNDFMVVDAISQHVYIRPEQIRRMADRHFGVGFDQLLIVEPPGRPDADFRYKIYNADGSEVENCGNGARCFARFVTDNKLTIKKRVRVETANGLLELKLTDKGKVIVDMGEPVLVPEQIPFRPTEPLPKDQQFQPAYPLTLATPAGGDQLDIGVVSMGNPHGVLVVDSIRNAPVSTLGPILEAHDCFPNKANIGFMEIVHRRFVRLRVFERGVGETLACGTGACAAVVSGQLRGLLDNRVEVKLPGGNLTIQWHGKGHSVLMEGPATRVFEGQIRL
ncbi:MAG: diaminopimelate epimerase [Gammaproteobacteria bacterium]|nr:MAG: diaminopimelate epimerase [Pseudomonadota bacterium]PIE38340.1 MAG: diaminopimelate epimerase [Gammaproteobacteria bacterium]